MVETEKLETYWQLKIDSCRKIVVCFELAYLTPEEAKIDAALALKPDSGPAYLITDVDGEGDPLEKTAQKLFQSNATVRGEMVALWQDLSVIGCPIKYQEGMGVLFQMQFFIFLHLLSILVGGQFIDFTVSSQFMGLVGNCFQEELRLDIMELMARYLYSLRLSPPVDAQAWNRSFYGLLIPRNHLAAVSWWNRIQCCIREADDMGFCEEYLCMRGEPGEAALVQETDEVYHRFKARAVRVAPDFPEYYYWTHHDAAVTVADSLAVPRILPPFRISASPLIGTWGKNDGLPMEVSKKNCIHEAHSCMVVPGAVVPKDLTLLQLFGDCEDKLREAFASSNLPCPWWLQSASCGAVAHGAEIAGGSETEAYCWSTQYRILGLLFVSALRPDNVMHPHLRCHFDFQLGKLLSVEIRRGTLSQVVVSEFMRGCGIVFDTGEEGWLSEKLKKRHKTGTDLIGLHVRNSWGEKCRVQRYFDDHIDTLFLMAVSCPNQDRNSRPCTNHLEVCGYGTICNCYHAVCERYSRQLMIHALQYTFCHGVRQKGGLLLQDRQENYAFVYRLVGEMGFHSVDNEQYHPNPERRLQLFNLPRWLPHFYSDPVREKMTGTTFVGRPPCERRCFSSDEMAEIAEVYKNQGKVYEGFERFLVEIVKKAVTRSRVHVVSLE